VRRTYGPRFSGGYQFPRTNSARLTRGEPIRREELGAGAHVTVTPLTGGRKKVFEVCAFYEDQPGRWVQHAYIAEDELEAREWFERLVRKARPSQA
jgi:hypothetical protein